MHDFGGVLDCHTCDEKLMEERGHDREGTMTFMVGSERVRRCPLTFVTPLSWEYIRAFSFYEKGSYPNGVIYTHETKKYLQAMAVLDNEFNRIKMKEAESVGKKK